MLESSRMSSTPGFLASQLSSLLTTDLGQMNRHLFLGKDKKLNFIIHILIASWDLLVDASVYILFGLVVAGLLRVFLNPNSIARHLGRGRFKSVVKAAFFGIPVPL
jgi:uncharacterized membrane protein YraQ (UPF0718 family)